MQPATVHPVRMLRWLYLGRLTLAAGIFGGAVGAWRQTTPETTLLATWALLLSVAMTAGSVWYTRASGRAPSQNFLYAQVLFDTLLVTAVVHMTNDGSSVFAPLYILVIVAGSLLLPLPGGMLIGALACILYLADLIVWYERVGAGAATVNVLGLSVPEPLASASLQIVLFAILALVTAAVGDRLRRTGSLLGEVESELRQLRLDTNDILAAIDTSLVTVDHEGRLIYMNVAAEAVLGLQEWKWRGRPVLEELDRVTPGLGRIIGRTLETQEPTRRSEILTPGVEGVRYLGVRTTILERAEMPWVTAVFQDITESKQFEDLSRRAERLEAVAELGASLAHEIRNPLASIRSAIEQLNGARLEQRDRDTLGRLVLSESDRLSRLLGDFMEFSRVELRRWGSVDMVKVTRDAIDLVEQHPDRRGAMSILFNAPTDPVSIDGDPDVLHRAVFNLVLNAVQHAGDRGGVMVELKRIAATELPRGIRLKAPVRLSVQDTGPGIPAEDVARIFDPFFTTRKGGTGLGLAMVHRAVEAHQGTILVDGASAEGARFTVYLPSKSVRRS